MPALVLLLLLLELLGLGWYLGKAACPLGVLLLLSLHEQSPAVQGCQAHQSCQVLGVSRPKVTCYSPGRPQVQRRMHDVSAYFLSESEETPQSTHLLALLMSSGVSSSSLASNNHTFSLKVLPGVSLALTAL